MKTISKDIYFILKSEICRCSPEKRCICKGLLNRLTNKITERLEKNKCLTRIYSCDTYLNRRSSPGQTEIVPGTAIRLARITPVMG